jgi:predicted small lipoprotein YifL
MNKLNRVAFFLSVSVILAGCGAKGPLILPEKAAPIEAPAETAPEAAAPTDDAATTPAETQAEEAVEDPVQPAEDD